MDVDGVAVTAEPVDAEAEPASASVVFGASLEQARRYADLLVDVGVERGLIGPREANRIWTRHVLNCAVVAPVLAPGARVIDVGSGAGLPGVPLALARPDVSMTLVEPLERRCIFLAEVIDDLGLANCSVARGRAQDVVDLQASADAVTSRAVAPLGKLAGWCVPLLRPGGELVALKGRSARAEVDRDGVALARLGLVEVRVEEFGAEHSEDPTTVIRAVLSESRTRAVSPTRRRR